MSVAAIETIARAVIRRDGRLLVARERGKSMYFLPGGHVEPGEPVEAALLRELDEELGTEGEIVSFLGAIEHGYTDSGDARHEIDLVFETTITAEEPAGQEEHLEFRWLTPDDLTEADLQPAALKNLLAGHSTSFWHGWTG